MAFHEHASQCPSFTRSRDRPAVKYAYFIISGFFAHGRFTLIITSIVEITYLTNISKDYSFKILIVNLLSLVMDKVIALRYSA